MIVLILHSLAYTSSMTLSSPLKWSISLLIVLTSFLSLSNITVSSHAQSFTFQTILPNGYIPSEYITEDRTNYEIQFNSVGNISDSGVLAVSGKFTIVNGGPEPGTEPTPASETSTSSASESTTAAGSPSL
jgi:hypothetical protein